MQGAGQPSLPSFQEEKTTVSKWKIDGRPWATCARWPAGTGGPPSPSGLGRGPSERLRGDARSPAPGTGRKGANVQFSHSGGRPRTLTGLAAGPLQVLTVQSRRRPAGGSGVTCSYGYINTARPAASPARGSTRKARRPRGPAANCVASARRPKPQSTPRAEDGATVSGHVIIAPRTRANPPLAHAEAGREATRVRHARRFFFYELLEKLILNSRSTSTKTLK